MMAKYLALLLLLLSTVTAQLYMSNNMVFDYPDEEIAMNYLPVFESYPDVLPEYRVLSYPPPSTSRQMWTGCGCAEAKTYGDYLRSRPKSRGQRMLAYYQMM
ncbi:unnamed protein product [Caenorhabditis sp. 36 PRJEB53466]|nr:unnamed protein product [Caenorhabditis sp. 36 PRJEB53466]